MTSRVSKRPTNATLANRPSDSVTRNYSSKLKSVRSKKACNCASDNFDKDSSSNSKDSSKTSRRRGRESQAPSGRRIVSTMRRRRGKKRKERRTMRRLRVPIAKLVAYLGTSMMVKPTRKMG